MVGNALLGVFQVNILGEEQGRERCVRYGG